MIKNVSKIIKVSKTNTLHSPLKLPVHECQLLTKAIIFLIFNISSKGTKKYFCPQFKCTFYTNSVPV